jgi:hypothetical protein
MARSEEKANPFQKFHVLTTHSRLAELKELMRCRGIVQDDLKDVWTEEVGDAADSHAIADSGPFSSS